MTGTGLRVAVLRETKSRAELPPPPGGWMTGRPDEAAIRSGQRSHEHVYAALEELGHRPFHVRLDGTVESLVGLAAVDADVFFNLTESYADDNAKDLHVAAYLEMLGCRYTGNGPRALHLGQDKGLTKKILRHHGVPTPDFAIVERGGRWRRDLEFPLIVKPAGADSSIGIDVGSVVDDDEALARRIGYVHEHLGTALIERYVDGRELYAAVVGDDPPEALPLVELDFSGMPEGLPRISGTEAKWWKGTAVFHGTPPRIPEDLTGPGGERVREVALDAYRVLGLRDYGRIDLRLDADGEPYVLEVNPNPWIVPGCSFLRGWGVLGRSYADLVAFLLDRALSRPA